MYYITFFKSIKRGGENEKKNIIWITLYIINNSSSKLVGELSKGERAGIIGGTTAVITGTLYNGSELQHQRKLERIDTEIRRNYETEAVIENAHRKYYNIGVPPKLQTPTYNSNQISIIKIRACKNK